MLAVNDDKIVVGSICSGTIKKDKSHFILPIKAAVVLIIVSAVSAYLILTQPQRTIVIDSSFSIKLVLNRFDRVVQITPENSKGETIAASLKLYNASIDSALLSIFSKAKENSYMSADSQISIYISSSKNSSPNLIKTTEFLSTNKVNAIINNNGNELSIKK